MDAKRKKIEKIYITITCLIVLVIIGIVIFFILRDDSKIEKNISLEDNSFIKSKQEECDYTIWLIDLNEKSYGAKIKFYDYSSNYITVMLGKNFDNIYKNTIKSTLIKNASKSTVNDFEIEINKYRSTVMNFLGYNDINKPISEFDRTKDIEKDIDTSRTIYENLKSGETIHYITLFEERLNYEISFYVENDVLYGEISYYVPSTYESEPDPNIDPSDIQEIEGVG